MKLKDDKYTRSLDALADNANADGNATNRLQYSIYDTVTLVGVSGETVLFRVTKGNAKFTNGTTQFRTTTDSDGLAIAELTDTTAETVTVSVTSTNYPSTPLTKDLNFIKGGKLSISSVTTKDGRVFAKGQPTIAWNGAVIIVHLGGGSGSYTWSVTGAGLALDENFNDGAEFVFSSSVETGTAYTITATDTATQDSVTYNFILQDFYESFGTKVFYIETDVKRLPSPAQLINLWSQWGPMSNYAHWTDKTSLYWTNENNLILATVVNLDTGSEGNDIVATGTQGYAKLKK
ncbi:hypothetical protein Q8V93_003428 [Enterobacter asburiae]|nr:hypothetical protein [Enterobacter asburiae]